MKTRKQTGEFAGRSLAHRPDRTDYDHRHFVNLIATAFILALGVAIGWTIKSFDRQLELEKCLNSGRRDCRQVIELPVRSYVKLGQ